MDIGKFIEENHYYLEEKNRRKTFRTWVFNDNEKCNADKMAEAGFIFTGSRQEPDAAQCFMCKKSLDGWENDDDPWKEHLKHAPHCDFAKLQKQQDNVTLGEYMDLKYKYDQMIIKNYYDDLKKSVTKDFDKLINAV